MVEILLYHNRKFPKFGISSTSFLLPITSSTQRDIFQNRRCRFLKLHSFFGTNISLTEIIMKNNTVLILFFFLISKVIHGQTQEATTTYGQKAILKADGTWKYVEEATTKEGKKVLLNADGTWKYSEDVQNIKGDSNGSINSEIRGMESSRVAKGTGSGINETSVSYSLQGRGYLKLPTPKYDYQGKGRVVVEVSVDRSGKVLDATPGAKGSTTLDEFLLKAGKEAALEATFQVSQDAPVIQKGTITYNFILK
jgi:hypothetical protein